MTFRNKDVLAELDALEKGRIRSEQVNIAYKQAFASVYPLLFGSIVIYFLFYNTFFDQPVVSNGCNNFALAYLAA